MTATRPIDVCIIGGGPAGSALALRLTQLGWRVLVLERETFPRRRVGESLSPGVSVLFEALGCGDILRHARSLPVQAVSVTWEGGRRFARIRKPAANSSAAVCSICCCWAGSGIRVRQCYSRLCFGRGFQILRAGKSVSSTRESNTRFSPVFWLTARAGALRPVAGRSVPGDPLSPSTPGGPLGGAFPGNRRWWRATTGGIGVCLSRMVLLVQCCLPIRANTSPPISRG